MKWLAAAVVYSAIDYFVFHLLNRWEADRKLDRLIDKA